MSENNLPDAEKLLAGIPRKPCASSDPLAEVARLRTEVERCLLARDEATAKHANVLSAYDAAIADNLRISTRATAAEKSRDEAIAELNKALETIGQLRVECNELETALGKASNLATSANQRLFDKEKEVSSLTETLGQLRSDLQKVEEERDAALDLIGRAILNMPSGKPEDGGLRQLPINKGVSKLRARAQSAEASLAKLREAALFLSDRISDFNPDDDNPAREFYGHVTPAAARLRSLLDEPDKDQKQ